MKFDSGLSLVVVKTYFYNTRYSWIPLTNVNVINKTAYAHLCACAISECPHLVCSATSTIPSVVF